MTDWYVKRMQLKHNLSLIVILDPSIPSVLIMKWIYQSRGRIFVTKCSVPVWLHCLWSITLLLLFLWSAHSPNLLLKIMVWCLRCTFQMILHPETPAWPFVAAVVGASRLTLKSISLLCFTCSGWCSWKISTEIRVQL